MELELKPGRYVLAISGGVDSMTLLDLVKPYHKRAGYYFIVAHLDHGIRTDSFLDRELVQQVAADLGITFVFRQAKLGSKTGEAKAREARYNFLEEVKLNNKAKTIVTAHHQDDLIETVIINLIRGSGRKGLSSLNSSRDLLRPLLGYPKADILTYAKAHHLTWREDVTNADVRYFRNYVRHRVVPKLTPSARVKLLEIINKSSSINQEMDKLILGFLTSQIADNKLSRVEFSMLPHNMAREVMATWLRSNNIRQFNKTTLERLVVNAKVGAKGQKFPVLGGKFLEVEDTYLALV